MYDLMADSVDPVARLRRYIADGGFTVGVRLPPERQLTDELGNDPHHTCARRWKRWSATG